ncbi:MAG: hypothetical protein ACT4NL_14240 [Pseudomarimonas sp.]
MTAQRWLVTANSSIAGVLGLLVVGLLFGGDVYAPKAMATMVLMFVLPAVLAAALATWKVGGRRLQRPTQAAGGALMLAIWTTLIAYAIYFLIVGLIGVPWAMMIAQSQNTSMWEALTSGFLVGGVALAIATVLGFLPAVGLCWWTSTLATRRRLLELANEP